MDDFGGVIGAFFIIIAVCAAVALFVSVATIMAGVGGLVGGGTAVKNYMVSFRKNVYMEKI